jgi:DNA-binding transcriptional MerR regulator
VKKFTLDEIARAAGTTGRNVRALQTLGLLQRPHLVGRTGFYGEDHLTRLRAILRLQSQGFSLAGIAYLFKALEAGLTLEQVLGLSRDLDSPDEDESFAGWPSTRAGEVFLAVPSTVVQIPVAS